MVNINIIFITFSHNLQSILIYFLLSIYSVTDLYSVERNLCVLSAPPSPDPLTGDDIKYIKSESEVYYYVARPDATISPVAPTNPCPSIDVGPYIHFLLILLVLQH